MKELIYLGTEETTFNNTKYHISTFVDVYNYQILRGTNLTNYSKLVKGNKYICDLDVKYNKKANKFVFYVTNFSE